MALEERDMNSIGSTMSRKRFLRLAVVSTAAASMPMLGGCSNNGRALSYSSLSQVLEELDRMESSTGLELQQDWSLYKVLRHLAQTIQGAMLGFSEVEPAAAQSVGKLAFQYFKTKGYMSHNLTQEVPLVNGQSEVVPDDGDLAEAYYILRNAIYDFQNFTGSLFPHFAYGELSYEDWELANAYHCADHFSSLTYIV